MAITIDILMKSDIWITILNPYGRAIHKKFVKGSTSYRERLAVDFAGTYSIQVHNLFTNSTTSRPIIIENKAAKSAA